MYTLPRPKYTIRIASGDDLCYNEYNTSCMKTLM